VGKTLGFPTTRPSDTSPPAATPYTPLFDVLAVALQGHGALHMKDKKPV